MNAQTPFKTIIAGSRSIRDQTVVDVAIEAAGWPISEVVCGGARGVDLLGAVWARSRGVPVKLFYPDWAAHGRAAGHVRNRAMGDYAEALIAVWDGHSRGTKGMIDYAVAKRLRVYVHTLG